MGCRPQLIRLLPTFLKHYPWSPALSRACKWNGEFACTIQNSYRQPPLLHKALVQYALVAAQQQLMNKPEQASWWSNYSTVMGVMPSSCTCL